MSVAEAAEARGVTPRHVRNLIGEKPLPAQMAGGNYVIRHSDLAKVPENRKPGPKPGPTAKGEKRKG